MKTGDKVNVKMGRSVQAGTVVKLLPGGRFAWINSCNYRREAKLADVTAAAPVTAPLSPYIQAWFDEENE